MSGNELEFAVESLLPDNAAQNDEQRCLVYNQMKLCSYVSAKLGRFLKKEEIELLMTLDSGSISIIYLSSSRDDEMFQKALTNFGFPGSTALPPAFPTEVEVKLRQANIIAADLLTCLNEFSKYVIKVSVYLGRAHRESDRYNEAADQLLMLQENLLVITDKFANEKRCPKLLRTTAQLIQKLGALLPDSLVTGNEGLWTAFRHLIKIPATSKGKTGSQLQHSIPGNVSEFDFKREGEGDRSITGFSFLDFNIWCHFNLLVF